MSKSIIRDLLYLDFDKAASIWSQLDEGLLERVSVTEDTARDQTAGTKFGIPGIAHASLGADYQHKKSTLQSKTLHHDLLNLVENRLLQAGLVTDMVEAVSADEVSADAIRLAVGKRPYLRAEGNSVLEDYRRILSIAEKFNEIIGFIGKATVDTVKKSAAYVELEKLVIAAGNEAAKTTDRNEKALKTSQVKLMRQHLDDLLKPQASAVEQWLIDGMRLFINTYMPTRINFRIYPFPSCPSFQVLCNLKRDCFLDADLDHLLYGYGNRPNVPLAVFGLITSLPPKEQTTFNPMREFEDDPELANSAGFEQAFRNVFAGMEGMESIMRYSRYPNVTVHPIAVYRSFAVNAT